MTSVSQLKHPNHIFFWLCSVCILCLSPTRFIRIALFAKSLQLWQNTTHNKSQQVVKITFTWHYDKQMYKDFVLVEKNVQDLHYIRCHVICLHECSYIIKFHLSDRLAVSCVSQLNYPLWINHQKHIIKENLTFCLKQNLFCDLFVFRNQIQDHVDTLFHYYSNLGKSVLRYLHVLIYFLTLCMKLWDFRLFQASVNISDSDNQEILVGKSVVKCHPE